MTSPRIPSFAVWLLTHLTSMRGQEWLIGDVTEEYQRSSSQLWLWKQVATAIAAGFWRDVTTHKVWTVQAVVVGWVILSLPGAFVSMFGNHLPTSWWRANATHPAAVSLGALCVMSLVACCGGWAVARLHRSHSAPMVLAVSLAVLLVGLINVLVLGVPKPGIFLGACTFYALSVFCGGVLGERHESRPAR